LTIGGQLIVGLGGAIVALVAAIPDIFVGFVKGIANIAVNAVKGFVGKFDEMKTALANVAVSVVNTLIDVFNKIPLVPYIPKITLDTKKLGTQMGLTSTQLQAVNEKFDKVNGTLEVSSEVVKDFAGTTNTATTATSKAGKAIEENQKKLDSYNASLKKSGTLEERRNKARKSESGALSSLTQANDDLASAKAKLAQIERGFGAGSPEALAAQKDLSRAQRDQERATFAVEEAIYSVADAEKNLAEVRKDPESSPMDVRRAELNLAEAKLSVTDAIDSQIDSTKELNDQQTLLNETIFGATIGSYLYDEALRGVEDATRQQASAFEAWEEAVTNTKNAQDDFNASLQATIDLIAKYPKILGGMPNPLAGVTGQVPVTAGGGFSLRPNDTYQININAAIAEEGLPKKVVDALQQYNRSVGKIPVKTK
jgi:chromosome segregation ATPase